MGIIINTIARPVEIVVDCNISAGMSLSSENLVEHKGCGKKFAMISMPATYEAVILPEVGLLSWKVNQNMDNPVFCPECGEPISPGSWVDPVK